jgi:hypothetical protein
LRRSALSLAGAAGVYRFRGLADYFPRRRSMS